MKIKNLIIATLLATAPAVSFGDTGIDCEYVADFSRAVMKGRQYGTPMRKMIEINNTASDEGLRAMNQKIIGAAYSRPQFATEHHKQRMITEFENEFYSTCLELKAAGAI